MVERVLVEATPAESQQHVRQGMQCLSARGRVSFFSTASHSSTGIFFLILFECYKTSSMETIQTSWFHEREIKMLVLQNSS